MYIVGVMQISDSDYAGVQQSLELDHSLNFRSDIICLEPLQHLRSHIFSNVIRQSSRLARNIKCLIVSLAMSMEKLVVATMMTFGLCLLGAYAFIGLPWLVLMAFILFCCRIVHECLRSKYPPQQFVKDSAVESAILPRERLGG